MISKEDFCKVIDLIRQQEKIDRTFEKALDLVVDTPVVYGAENKYLEALLMIMKSVFHDQDDYIGWWLCEDVKIEISEKTPDELYDFLVSRID